MNVVIDARTETPEQQAARRLAAPALRDGYLAEALHTYRDAEGKPLFWRIRAKHPDGRKWIKPMHQDASGRFILGEPPAPQAGKPLYNLAVMAKRPDDVVIVTEGEKAADRLTRMGLLATTSGGATSAAAADWRPLQGRRVIVWPDHDEPGTAYGRDVAEALLDLGGDVRIIDVAGLNLPAKGDAWDWVQSHPEATAADVLALPVSPVEQMDEWPEPQPLPGELPPVDAFDPALLPDAIRAWVMDITERVSCPPDYVAVPAMLALAAVIGRKVAIRPQRKTDWTVTANLWGLVIGRPGMMKSPAMAQATAPLKRLAARAQEEYEAAMADWQLRQKEKELRADASEKDARKLLAKDPTASISHLLTPGDDEPEPTLRRYTTANATLEALAELLRQNPQGLLLERDEIMGLLRELDRDEKADHRAFLLESWSGDGSYTVDRIGRGFNLRIDAMCLSVIGTTQPARMQAYMADALYGGAGDDGLVQRFSMAIWPDATGEWRNVDRWPDGEAKKVAWAVFDRLDKLNPSDLQAEQDTDIDGNPEGPPFLRLSEDALALFLEWRTELESRLRGGELHPALESHVAKYRKLVPALALICHLADGGTGHVTEAAMLRSLAWAVYLESHAQRIYGGALAPEVEAARAILRRIKRGDLPRDGFGSRDVWRPGWSGLDDPQIVTAGLTYLVEMDWMRADTEQTKGRPATRYTLNPRAQP